MKEFSKQMSSVELRLAYAKFMSDKTKSDELKTKATEEYHRIMDEKIRLSDVTA